MSANPVSQPLNLFHELLARQAGQVAIHRTSPCWKEYGEAAVLSRAPDTF